MKIRRGTVNDFDDDMIINSGGDKHEVSIKIAIIFDTTENNRKAVEDYIKTALLPELEGRCNEEIG